MMNWMLNLKFEIKTDSIARMYARDYIVTKLIKYGLHYSIVTCAIVARYLIKFPSDIVK